MAPAPALLSGGVERRAAVLLLVLAAAGCRAGAARLDQAREGLGERAQAAADRLTSRLGLPPLPVSVVPGAAPGAWAWPDGRVELSAGLVRRCDDDQLAAALAHEIGHLLADGHVAWPRALDPTGAGASSDEARADLHAMALLVEAGIPRRAIADLLRVLEAARVAPRADITARLAAAEAALR